jgi:hypothetical protein
MKTSFKRLVAISATLLAASIVLPAFTFSQPADNEPAANEPNPAPSTSASPAANQPNPAPSTSASPAAREPERPPQPVSFACAPTFDRASRSQIPTTLAWVPDRGGNVAIVRWKSQYFSGSQFDNQRRCQIASQRFQNLWNAGQLNFITHGKINNLPVICGVDREGGNCTSQNVLFTLKPHSNPELTIAQLTNVIAGRASSGAIYESGSSGPTQTYVSVSSLMRRAPIESPRQ